jgi:tripartite-type tricarboxylate transporter receptor subunit TctC
VIIPLTFKAPGYDPLKDFTALAGVASYYNVMALSSAMGVKTPGEFGAWLKANPGKANYGIPAVGSVPQFAGLLVGKSLGTPMVAVPYRGGAPLVQDLLGGQVPAAFLSLTESIEHHRTGKMHVMAVSGTTRAKSAPDIPTFQELGIKGVDKNPWLAFFGPKGLPPEFVDRFSRSVASALSDPDHVSAQFAIQVASDWQGKELGHLMLSKLIAYLRNRGTRELTGLCLKENTGMAALARSLGFVVSPRSIASETVSMTLAL